LLVPLPSSRTKNKARGLRHLNLVHLDTHAQELMPDVPLPHDGQDGRHPGAELL